MRRFQIQAMICVFGIALTSVQAADAPAKKILPGTWVGKMEIDEAKAKKLFPKGTDPHIIESAMKRIRAMIAKSSVTLTINSDGTSKSVTTQPDPTNPGKTTTKTETGTWEVVKQDGKVVTMKLSSKNGDQVKNKTIKITLVNKNRFDLKDDPELKNAPIKSAWFTRKK